MTKSIEIHGLRELQNDFDNAFSLSRKEGKAFSKMWGEWVTGRVKAYTLDAGAVDLGTLVQGIDYHIKDSGNTIETTVKPDAKGDKYAIYVERGAKPHRPPVKALQGWADRHGIPVWAVVRKIEREGTDPRWMWRDTYNDVLDKADIHAREFGDRILKRL